MMQGPEQSMNHFSSPPMTQSLPDGFSQDLREVDSQLAEVAARQSSAPVGLADRVFAASVSMLPQPKRTSKPQLRFTSASAFVFRRTAWAQLAMAASVAIACGVAVWLFHGPRSASRAEWVARNDSRALATQLINDLAAPLHEANTSLDTIAIICETSGFISMDQVTDPLAMKVASLGIR